MILIARCVTCHVDVCKIDVPTTVIATGVFHAFEAARQPEAKKALDEHAEQAHFSGNYEMEFMAPGGEELT